jgi:hypothetical protein
VTKNKPPQKTHVNPVAITTSPTHHLHLH